MRGIRLRFAGALVRLAKPGVLRQTSLVEDALRDKLRSEVLACGWLDLAPQLTRGALLLAEPQLDFLDVAVAIAADDRAGVEAWLLAGTLRRAAEPDRLAYEASPELRFQFVVVQPWVLAQPIVSAAEAPG